MYADEERPGSRHQRRDKDVEVAEAAAAVVRSRSSQRPSREDKKSEESEDVCHDEFFYNCIMVLFWEWVTIMNFLL